MLGGSVGTQIVSRKSAKSGAGCTNFFFELELFESVSRGAPRDRKSNH